MLLLLLCEAFNRLVLPLITWQWLLLWIIVLLLLLPRRSLVLHIGVRLLLM